MKAGNVYNHPPFDSHLQGPARPLSPSPSSSQAGVLPSTPPAPSHPELLSLLGLCSTPCPPPHPQDTLKYTFSFLQLEQGGSCPKIELIRGRLQPQWSFQAEQTARGGQVSSDTPGNPPQATKPLSPRASSEGQREAPARERPPPHPIITEPPEAPFCSGRVTPSKKCDP